MHKRRLGCIAVSLTLLSCAHSAKAGREPAAEYKGHGVESVSADDLKAYAPPSLPAEVSTKIAAMLDVQSPGAGMLHPDGKRLYFTWGISGTRQVWKINHPKAFPEQMTGGRDTTSLAEITPDGKYLILQRDRNGEENPGIYLQLASGGRLIPLYHRAKVRAEFQFVSDDSTWIYFAANDLSPDSMAIYRYNLKTERIEPVYTEKGIWEISDENGDDLILSKATGALTSEHFLFNLKSKSLQPIIGHDEREEYTVQFGPRKNTYLVLTPKLGNFRRLYLYENSVKELRPITPSLSFDVSGFNIDKPKTRILFTVNENGYSRLHGLDAKTLKPIKIPTFADADHVMAGTTTRDGRITMLSIVTGKAPRLSFSLHWSTLKLTQWTMPSSPEVDLSKFVRSTLEYYPTRDGQKIPMFVRRPPKCEKVLCPVVVHFHGGPEGQSVAGFNTYAQLFADEGFIFVEPNVRGSNGYGKEWLDSDNGAKRLNVITDIEDCSKYIRSEWARGGVAPKIGVIGWSYGGYSTLMAMTRFAGAYDVGVALVGMSNLLTFLNNTAPYRRILRASEYGDPEKDKDALQDLSPINYINQIKSPLMIVQGANDPRVPVGEAVQIQKVLAERKIPSSLIVFADEGHGTQKKENRILELGHALNFIGQNLKTESKN
jgi:protease II